MTKTNIVKKVWTDVSAHSAAHIAERYLYAGYGSNLNIEQMTRRCKTAELHGHGVIPDARLQFARVLTIREDDRAVVPVGLYELKAADVTALDRYEGLASRVYRRVLCAVDVAGIGYVRCFTYIKNNDRIAPPTDEYFDRCARGYKDWNFDLRRLHHAREAAVRYAAAHPEKPKVQPSPSKRPEYQRTAEHRAELPVRDVEWGIMNNESYWREAGGGPWYFDTTTPEDSRRGVVTGTRWRPKTKASTVRRPKSYRDSDGKVWHLHADGIWKRTPPTMN